MLPKSIKAYKISSFKQFKSAKEKEKEKEKIYSDRKRKLRKVQTMDMKNIEPDLININENKKPELKKNGSAINILNYDEKEILISTKLTRTTKYLIGSYNKTFRKKNSLLENKNIKLKKDKSISKQNEDKNDDEFKRRNNNSSTKKFKIFSDS